MLKEGSERVYLDEMAIKKPKELTAFCSSSACLGLYEMKPKPNAKRGDVMCPDCGWALFWQHPDGVGIDLKGRASHRFSRAVRFNRSIYNKKDMEELDS